MIELVSVPMLGLGLFTLLAGEQQSAQAANAEALREKTTSKGTVDCFSIFMENTSVKCYDCGSCELVTMEPLGSSRTCTPTTQDDQDLQP